MQETLFSLYSRRSSARLSQLDDGNEIAGFMFQLGLKYTIAFRLILLDNPPSIICTGSEEVAQLG